MKRIFLILKEDILYYPPVLSIINALLDLNCKVVHIGVYSDVEQRKKLENLGVTFCATEKYNGKANLFNKALQQIRFKKSVNRYLRMKSPEVNDLIWIMQSETLCLLSAIVSKYKTIVHPLEYVSPHINWKYKLLNPSFDMGEVMRNAYKVVCCEYNRAQITKGLFNLETLPCILPNKVYTEVDYSNIPLDIAEILETICEKLKGKKVILYQGIFLDKERRLEEFCQAITNMSDEYVFIAMGIGSELYDELKHKYESEKIIFIPFIRPPYHLLITKMASIGVLSYFPRQNNVATVINPLYCAPNKIFEYARYGIPMISNDIPGLYYIYMEYKCGKCVSYPMTTEGISEAIEAIFSDYESYVQGARAYYNSVDVKKIVNQIITD